MPNPYIDVVTVNVVVANPSVTAAGFGVPMILTPNCTWSERTRTYTTLAGVLADWAATTPEYAKAAAFFAQDPSISSLVIGRAVGKPTQIHEIKIESAVVGRVYAFKYTELGVTRTVSYTAVGGNTATDIATGLRAAFVALTSPVPGFTATLGGYLNTVVILTGNAAGNWSAVEVLNDLVPSALPDLLTVSETEAAPTPTLATDLANIKLENNDWYGFVMLYQSAAIVSAAAAWAETNEKQLIVALPDTHIALDADSGATDEAHVLKGLGYKYTHVFFHPRGCEHADAAEMGSFFPVDPGQDDWTLKTLIGVSIASYTDTQKTNLRAKNCNWYQTFGSVGSIGGEGKEAGGQYIDVTRDVDQMRAWYAEYIAAMKKRYADLNQKVPFTDAGIALVRDQVAAVNARGVRTGIVSEGTDSITVPLAADVSDADKATRTLPDVNTNWTLAGSIHHIEVNVAISY